MSPFEPLQPDSRRMGMMISQNMCIADTRMIALIASKKNFNPDKERLLIEKARTTKCRCRHFTGTELCFYRSCRHFADTDDYISNIVVQNIQMEIEQGDMEIDVDKLF